MQAELELLEALEEESPLNATDGPRKVEIMTLLHNLYADEEMYWFQRSHQKWLLEGDSNSKYFHKIANGRKRKNTIFSLEVENDCITKHVALLQHATDYYKSLFGPEPMSNIDVDTSLRDSRENVTPEENQILTRSFSEEEVREALFSMKKNMAPGPDSFLIEFFQIGWDFMKPEIMYMFHEFHGERLDIQRLNYGVITLLPKIKDAFRIQQFRPICLLNCLYKLVTKVLTIRLNLVIHRLISLHQNAFMEIYC